jgi:hypothetical protein
MTAEVKYRYEDQSLDELSAIMGDIQVRRLPGSTYRFDLRRAGSRALAALAGTPQVNGRQAEASTGGTDGCRLNC